MIKIACDIIKDLLPLYVDDVCSEKTKDLIEEHLAGCEECQKYYEALQDNLPEITESASYDSWSNFEQEKAFILKVSKKIQKKMTLNRVVTGFLCLLLVLCLIASTSSLTTNPLQFIPFFDQRLAVEDISVTEIYELENGNIYFTLWGEEDITWSYMSSLEYDEYLEEETEYFASAQITRSTWWDKYVRHMGTSLHSISFIYQTEQIKHHTLEDEQPHDISSIYYIGKGDERLTIWEKGQELDKAPEEIERKVSEGRMYSDYDRQGFALYNWDETQNIY